MRLNDIDVEKHYSMSNLSDIIMSDGRRLDEALKNHPFAPNPRPHIEVPDARKQGKYFLGNDVLNFVNSCEKAIFKNTPSNVSDVLKELSYARHELKLAEKERDAAIIQKKDAINDYYDAMEKSKEKSKKTEEQVALFFHQYMWKSEELFSDKIVCGVYFLRSRGNIIYVGQSRNILSRIGQHKQTKEFDSVSFVKCEENNLNDVEGFFVRLLLPTMNIVQNGFICAPRTSVERFEDVTRLLNEVKHVAQ